MAHNINQNYFNQLPRINSNTKNIEALDYSKINEYFTNGYFAFKDKKGNINYAASNIAIIKNKNLYSQKLWRISQDDLYTILERSFSTNNTNKAINHLEHALPSASAKNIDYVKSMSGFAVVFLWLCMFFINIFNLINNFVYILQNALKGLLFIRGILSDKDSPINKISDDIPIYSVLIPLYKEERQISSILKAMQNLHYPKEKLDVKLIIENDDVLTMRAIQAHKLPPYIHVIKVPYSLPRTKPKALNYAMAYVRGKYVAVYDAEDIPEPNQLLKALYAFNNLPENYVCVQAKLNFYNANTNLLTKFFSLEYSLWFNCLLKGLSIMNLPVTLGGTSNHFKVSKLHEVGYWDAYNVTEDADLGIRFYLNGYKVHLINSTTMEEAPTDIGVWIAQRARWIKGFMQTIFVFMKTKKDYKKFNIIKIFTVYTFVGLSTYSFFCLPWILLALIFELPSYIYYLWLVNSIFSFAYMYAVAYFILTKDRPLWRLSILEWITLILWPLYFLLHTIASYRAIWEIIKSPFKWNKTPHGDEDNLG